MQKIGEYFTKLKAKKKPGQTFEEVLEQDMQADSFPASESPNIKHNVVSYAIINVTDIRTAYTDLTG